MADYRLPMDADGVKYHGTVDQNEENPGHFMYGLDENGNKRIIRTDEQGNVLTRVTGSIVEEIIYQKHTDIQPNSKVDIVNRFDLTGYRYIKYATWSMTYNDKIALRKRERTSEFVLSPYEEVLVVDDALRSTEVMDIEGTQIDIMLVNNSDELITEIRVAVIGYKM